LVSFLFVDVVISLFNPELMVKSTIIGDRDPARQEFRANHRF
jgi:hypothetical protein